MKRQIHKLQHTLFQLYFQLQAKQKPEGGYIVVVVMAMVLVLGSMLITAALTSKVDGNNSRSSTNSTTGFYAAEAGLNLRAQDIRNTFEGYNRPTGTSPNNWSACKDADGSNNGTLNFQCDSSKTFQGQSVSTFVIEDINNPVSVTIDTGEQFAGLLAQEYRYDVNSVAFDKQSQPTASLQMRFKSRLVPLFQFAVFYEQDLDFSNPPSMTMNGPIHSNGSIYLNSGSETLSINGQVTTAGQLFRGERQTDTCGGTVRIFDPKPVPGSNRVLACGPGRRAYAQTDLSDWDNQIRVGIPTLTVPSVSEFDPLPGREYWDKADLRIALVLDSSENVTGIEVQNSDGNKIVSDTNALLGDTCAPIKTTLAENSSTTDSTLTRLKVSDSTVFNPTTVRVSPTVDRSFDPAKDGPALQIESGSTVNSNAIIMTNASSSTSNTLQISKRLDLNANTNDVVRKATVWTSDTFRNFREKDSPTGTNTDRNNAKRIRMLNVDVRSLMTCAKHIMGGKGLNDSSDGGLVWFLTVKGPKSLNNVRTGVAPNNVPNNYGIRLYNGAELESTNSSDRDPITGQSVIRGLSVVSDQAIYIRGDYNTIAKKPAAIMADTINVLSNAWPLNDSYSRAYDNGLQNETTPTYVYSYEIPGEGFQRLASNTSINAAFLSGIDLTGGGVNNYPRLQEDWVLDTGGSRATLTYRGSMVSLGLPRRVNADFCGSGTSSNTAKCNIYTPPTRNWDYDTAFNNASNLPPLTPRFVYLRQERFSRDYTRTSFLPLSSPFASFFPNNLFASLPTVIGGRFIF
jgi:Tfp pilus assembly protein PilX